MLVLDASPHANSWKSRARPGSVTPV